MTLVNRPLRVLAALFAALAMALALAFTGHDVARAEPDTVAEAQKNLDKIHAEASAIDAKYTELQAQLDAANASLKQIDSDVATQTKKVTSMRSVVSQLALSQYQSGGFDVTVQMLSNGTEDTFMSQLSTMQALTDRTNDQFQVLQAEQAKLQALQSSAGVKRDAIAKATADQAALAKEYDQKQAAAEKVLAKLTAQEKARLKALQEARERAAAAAAAAAAESEANEAPAASNNTGSSTAPKSTSNSTKKSTSSTSKPKTTTVPPASGRAASAVAYAKAQVGKSYRMGSTGPRSYDCSGLMLRAWGSAGVSLPRTSQSQYRAGVRVPMSQLRPGDLVFYYGGISHVGIYVGNGRIVHAANPRTGVAYASLYSMPVAGARRVG